MTQRFTSECELCAELVADYVSVSNEIVDRKERIASRPEPTAQQLASAMLDHALQRKGEVRKRLLRHKKQAH